VLKKDSRQQTVSKDTTEYHLDGQEMYLAINKCRDAMTAYRDQAALSVAPKSKGAGGVDVRTIAYNAVWRAMIDGGAHVTQARIAAEKAAEAAIAAESGAAKTREGACLHEWGPMPIGNGQRCSNCGESRDGEADA
jgi:hypothetical protein